MRKIREMLNYDRCVENRKEWINKQLSDIPKGKRILDAGAGMQPYKSMCKHLEYISQDFCQYAGGSGRGLQDSIFDTSKIDIVSDIANIPVESESFDVVLCTEVLEHVIHPDAVVAELSRILGGGG